MSKECLTKITGTCAGCSVVEIIESKSPAERQDPGLIERVGKEYCPAGESPVLPEKVKQSIW